MEVVLPGIDRLDAVQHAAVVAVGDVAYQCSEKTQVQLEEARVEDPQLVAFWQDVAKDDAADALGLVSVGNSEPHGCGGEEMKESKKLVGVLLDRTGFPALLEHFLTLPWNGWSSRQVHCRRTWRWEDPTG